MTLTVRIITPDKTIWDKTAQEVILPSTSGQLGILTDHAPLLTNLDIGVIRVRLEKEWKSIVVMGGFAEIEDNEVKILVNGAQLGESINKEDAQNDLIQAQQSLEQAKTTGDTSLQNKATKNVKKARARLQAAS